ncbi:hypothetical protein C2869_12345 [Saccharobesus litoralis]|uniref:Tetratricopeptide repeat protein n=1 Tax=Saccharobesus litoralis TaxID=2172099 RepID=A0A2S0VSH9_9ALTE|nr:glycosyltransferase family 9 protein [Saccharobesus litoralis]AWB67176.1 hypothetical protein C2869_12345 [Saccharobesus litoralis]
MNPNSQFAQAEQALMQGQFNVALDGLKPLSQAMQAEPNYHKALATCYFALKEYHLAVQSFDAAIKLQPNDPHILSSYGTALYQNKQIQPAVDKFCAAINQDPTYVEARIKLVAVLKECNQHQDALKVIFDGLKLNPEDETLKQLQADLSGVVPQPNLHQPRELSHDPVLENLWQSRQLNKILELAFAGLNSQAKQQENAHKIEDLARYVKQITDIQPSWWQAWLTQALCIHRLGKAKDALPFYRNALALNNKEKDLLINAAIAFNSQFEFAAGHYCLDRMRHLGHDLGLRGYGSLGFAYLEQGQYHQAKQAYLQASQSQGDEITPDFSSSLVHLTLGEFQLGWQKYSLRLSNIVQYQRALKKGIPEWNGQALTDKTLAIIYEQGHGDTIQFLRFLPKLCAQAKQVIFQVNPLIASLIQHYAQDLPNLTVISRNIERADYLLSLMELGRIWQLDETSITQSCSTYLTAPSEKVKLWQPRCATHKFKVAIAWSGNPDNKRDLIRSIALNDLLPIVAIEDIQFYSLQIDPVNHKELSPRIIDFSEQIQDFTDTAAIIEHMDLVISVDTGVAHLAAAMGKPVWILLSYVPDWRWLLDRKQSIWYPSVTLYRQPQLNQWQGAIEQLHLDLTSLLPNSLACETEIRSLLDNQYNDIALRRINARAEVAPPLSAEMQYQQVQALVGTGHINQALTLAKALTQNTIPQANNVYYQGVLAEKAKNLPLAFSWLAQAFALAPTNLAWLLTLTTCALKLGKSEFALELIKLAEKSIGYHQQMVLQKAYIYMCQHEFAKAESELLKGITQDPNHTWYQFSLSQLYLQQGQFERGWRLFESRPVTPNIAKLKLALVLPEWQGLFGQNRTGQEITGQQSAIQAPCLFVYGEQGLGDQIMCLRYLSQLFSHFAHINLCIDQTLHEIVRSSLSHELNQRLTLIAQNEFAFVPGNSDLHCALYSLPYKFGELWRYEAFDKPYLTSKAKLPDSINHWLTQHGNQLKVGLVWQGNSAHERDAERSIDLEQLDPILNLDNIAFCSLQQTHDNLNSNLQDFSNELKHMHTTTALINQLDLVIAVDTSVAHLTGALGKPCWTLLSYLPDPRWQTQGHKTFWYQSMRLYRQPQIADWTSVVQQLAQDLAKRVNI